MKTRTQKYEYYVKLLLLKYKENQEDCVSLLYFFLWNTIFITLKVFVNYITYIAYIHANRNVKFTDK